MYSKNFRMFYILEFQCPVIKVFLHFFRPLTSLCSEVSFLRRISDSKNWWKNWCHGGEESVLWDLEFMKHTMDSLKNLSHEDKILVCHNHNSWTTKSTYSLFLLLTPFDISFCKYLSTVLFKAQSYTRICPFIKQLISSQTNLRPQWFLLILAGNNQRAWEAKTWFQ